MLFFATFAESFATFAVKALDLRARKGREELPVTNWTNKLGFAARRPFGIESRPVVKGFLRPHSGG